MENPYKTCDGCRLGLGCDELANCRDLSLAWEDGYRAGLEAAAGKAILEQKDREIRMLRQGFVDAMGAAGRLAKEAMRDE